MGRCYFKTPRRVVAIGAHPDDVEQGMGATLAKHSSKGDETYLIICTLGIGGACGDQSEREIEAKRAAEILGANLRIIDYPVLNLNRQSLEFEEIMRRELDDIYADRIYTHSPYDYHQVHSSVAKSVTAAAAGVDQLIYYEDISSTTPEFRPNAYVDVTNFMDAKLNSLHQHRTQSSKLYLQDNVLKSLAFARYVMSKIGRKPGGMAEAFAIERMFV